MNGLTLHIRGDLGDDLWMALPPGDAGTEQTIDAMREIAHAYATHALVRVVAGSVRTDAVAIMARHALPRVSLAEYYALFNWFKRRVKFCEDPKSIELIQRPDELIRQVSTEGKACGDCDDASTLGAAILLALGHKPVFITVARGGNFKHVYWGVRDPVKGLIPLDPQEFDRVGDEADNVSRRRVWEV